jgi:hypothetical protein
VREHKARIDPVPDDEWMCNELVGYYLDCIVQSDSSCEMPDTPFEAAYALVDIFNWLLVQSSEGRQTAANIAIRLADLFREGSPEIQNHIETGFLEHVLETPIARPIFGFWSEDSILAESYHAALKWGLAHSIDEGHQG